ncbi:MAG: hypothetical protein WCL32_17070, partial [Planctomycetota bacterium]
MVTTTLLEGEPKGRDSSRGRPKDFGLPVRMTVPVWRSVQSEAKVDQIVGANALAIRLQVLRKRGPNGVNRLDLIATTRTINPLGGL